MKQVICYMSLLLFLSFSFSGCNDRKDSSNVQVITKPVTSAQNAFYPGNRKPLVPASFIKLPLGSIHPKGWILKWLELQKNGLCGHLGEISAWLEKDNNAWLSEGGDHGWEEVPYWLRGYSDMAFIFDDPAMKKETMIWINAILKSQKENGWFGPEVRSDNGNLDFWPNMVVLFMLQNYYEYTHDVRVIPFMTKYFRFELTVPDKEFLSSYWENSRGGDNLYSVYWLYNLTGDKFLLDLARKIHLNTANWEQESTLPNWHNVNIAECFREPATYYMQTGDSADLKATYNDYFLVRRTFGQVPGGMFGADENARMGYVDPRQGTETCGFAEQMTSDGILTRITGDPMWADNCEDVLFNSFPAAFTPDMKALRYITCPNQVTADDKNHSPGIANNGPFLAMNPFSSRCCQHNHGHALPYYLENLVMASNDNGLAAVMYNACVTKVKVGDGTELTLTEDTRYPFEQEVRFTLNTPQKVSFPIYLRIPGWCEQASVQINGMQVKANAFPDTFIRIDREWSNNDQIRLELPMRLSCRTWQVNQNSVSVNYGPLTFSLKIAEEYKKISNIKSAIGDSKWQKTADPNKWPAYKIEPVSPWNYGLVLDKNSLSASMKIVHKKWPKDNFPFTPSNVPIEIQAKGQRIPTWGIDQYGLVAVLPFYPVKVQTPVENITLIPMGAARLRISAFPSLN
ncbi:beta-L-arabinofuranosidase domain-containing protein [Prolixibacter sp. SD074]|uniref:beta-L-arabinofuranosidase domain-containing protein n=1 Tax=Prolixibacter sp. SD074 TaxID=2652391 RepID=UPI001299254A|nr:beta-L-arabinofuranosidase domain-containing protein [Prolixibacter sp. SD074]